MNRNWAKVMLKFWSCFLLLQSLLHASVGSASLFLARVRVLQFYTIYVSLLHNKLSTILGSKEIFWNFKLFQNKNMEAVFSLAGDITPAKSCYL